MSAIDFILNHVLTHDGMYGFATGLGALGFFNAVLAERRAKIEDHWRAYADAQNAVLWYISALLLILVAK